jgi:hypothetical protein
LIPGDVEELGDKTEALLSLSKESIVDSGMKLRDHVLALAAFKLRSFALLSRST